jgi:hypothetical protein
LALDRSVLDYECALSLLAVDDDWFRDALLWDLSENGIGKGEHTDN